MKEKVYGNKNKKKNMTEPTTKVWRCAHLDCNKMLLTFLIQTLIGTALLSACFYAVSVYDCEKSAPFWGIIGTIVAFFFRKIPFDSKGANNAITSQSRHE